jgi:hypothetical protein
MRSSRDHSFSEGNAQSRMASNRVRHGHVTPKEGFSDKPHLYRIGRHCFIGNKQFLASHAQQPENTVFAAVPPPQSAILQTQSHTVALPTDLYR